MSKYICMCGMTFKKSKIAEEHVKILTGLEIAEPYPLHKIFKRQWKGRLIDALTTANCSSWMRYLGFIILYFVIINHFSIKITFIESLLIGLGLGLISCI